jgi:hypothetical protein
MHNSYSFLMLCAEYPDSAQAEEGGSSGPSEQPSRDGGVVLAAIDLRKPRIAPSVASEPMAALRAWRMVCAVSGSRHLVGLLQGTDTVRFTSPVTDVDALSRRITTSSGRVYHLDCPPTSDPVLLLSMALHADAQQLGALVDVSEAVWIQFQLATQ